MKVFSTVSCHYNTTIHPHLQFKTHFTLKATQPKKLGKTTYSIQWCPLDKHSRLDLLAFFYKTMNSNPAAMQSPEITVLALAR